MAYRATATSDGQWAVFLGVDRLASPNCKHTPMYTLANNVAIKDLGQGDVLNKANKSVGTSSFGCSHCHRSLNDSPPQSIYILEIVKDITQCIRLTPLDRLQAETCIKTGFVNG